MRSICLGALVVFFLTTGAHAGVNSWTQRGPHGGAVFRIIAHPTDANVAYAATESTVYKSSDGGSTWRRVPQSFGNGYVDKILLDPSNPDRLYVTASATGLWRSNDGGDSFERLVATPASLSADAPFALAISSDGNSIYYNTSTSKFFRSTDGGASFSERTLMPDFGMTLIVDPNDGAIVYAGGYSRLMKTSNGGDTWVTLNTPGGSPTIYTMALIPGSPNQLWTTTAAGISGSSDDGTSWSAPMYPNYQLFSDPAVPGILYAGPNNGAGILYRYSAGNWTAMPMAPSRLFAVGTSASNSQKLLAASPLGIFSSTNTGATWSRSDDGLDGVVVRQLATGGGRVYSAGDYDEIGIGDASEGLLLRSIHAPELPYGSARTRAIGAHPTDPNIILAAWSDAGLRRSTDGGISWQDGPANLASSGVHAIAFDPRDPQIVWLYATTPSSGHVYRSDDGGLTFSPVGSGVPSAMPTQLLVDPRNSSHLFLVTSYTPPNSGVFRSADGGVTWTKVLPSTGVTSVAIDPFDSARIYAVASGTVQISNDNGLTFQQASSFTVASYGSPVTITVDPTISGVIYVRTSGASAMRSVDAAQSWERIADSSDSLAASLIVNAAAPTVLLAGSVHGVQSFEIAPDVQTSILQHSGSRTNNVPTFFDVQLQNNGPLAATTLAVDIRAPTGSTNVSAQHPLASCTTSDSTVHCSLPYLQVNAPTSIRVNYTPPANSTLEVQASAHARERDPNESNNAASASATSSAPANGGGGGGGGGTSNGGGGGGSMSLAFMLSLSLLPLIAGMRHAGRRLPRSPSAPYRQNR